jgi:hypothetical protein
MAKTPSIFNGMTPDESPSSHQKKSQESIMSIQKPALDLSQMQKNQFLSKIQSSRRGSVVDSIRKVFLGDSQQRRGSCKLEVEIKLNKDVEEERKIFTENDCKEDFSNMIKHRKDFKLIENSGFSKCSLFQKKKIDETDLIQSKEEDERFRNEIKKSTFSKFSERTEFDNFDDFTPKDFENQNLQISASIKSNNEKKHNKS